MYKLVVLAVVLAAAQAQYLAAPAAYAGYAHAPVAYAGHAAPVAYAGYAHAAPAVAVHAAPAVAHAPVVAKTYAAPPARVVEEAPIVEQYTTPVEQHGYSVRY